MSKTTIHKRAEKNTLTHGAVLLRGWFDRHPKITRTALGSEIGVTRGTINHILGGTQQPTGKTIIDLYYRCEINPLEWGNVPRKR